jgi:hypothetical protein
MHPATRPRHPFKALLAVVAMAALVHGMGAHADPRGDHHGVRVQFIDSMPWYEGCLDADDDMLADVSAIEDDGDDRAH